MIILHTLTYKNFQSVGNTPIAIQLDKCATTLVGGLNGAGKSTTIEALTYCMFGKSLKKVKLQGLINSINKKKLLVTLEFTNNGRLYKIVRGEKPKVFELYEDGELFNQAASTRSTQEQLEYILGFDYKLFTQVLVLNKERYVPFMDSDAAARRKIVEDILDINVFSYASILLKEEIKTNTTELNNLKFKVTSDEDKIVNLQRLIDNTKSNQDELINDQQLIISNALDSIALLETESAELQSTIDANYVDTDAAMKELSKKTNEFNMFSMQFKTKISDLNSKLKFFETNDVCPTCHQDISTELKDVKNAEYCEAIDEYNAAKIECDASLADLEQQSAKLRNIQLEQRTLNDQLRNIKSKINLEMSKADSAAKSIDKLKSKPTADGYIVELNTLTSELAASKDKLSALLEEESTLKEMLDMLKDDGIKAHLISEYIDFINEKINEYLYQMDFYLNITFDNNFNDTIHSSQYEGFTYDNLSTGQKCRVNLAIWLALLEVASLKNSISCNLLFLDEILENIDSVGVQSVMKLITSKLKDKNVFVITQRFDEFRDSFQSDILFKLQEDFTVFA